MCDVFITEPMLASRTVNISLTGGRHIVLLFLMSLNQWRIAFSGFCTSCSLRVASITIQLLQSYRACLYGFCQRDEQCSVHSYHRAARVPVASLFAFSSMRMHRAT
jgi:hypothetical protein